MHGNMNVKPTCVSMSWVYRTVRTIHIRTPI